MKTIAEMLRDLSPADGARAVLRLSSDEFEEAARLQCLQNIEVGRRYADASHDVPMREVAVYVSGLFLSARRAMPTEVLPALSAVLRKTAEILDEEWLSRVPGDEAEDTARDRLTRLGTVVNASLSSLAATVKQMRGGTLLLAGTFVRTLDGRSIHSVAAPQIARHCPPLHELSRAVDGAVEGFAARVMESASLEAGHFKSPKPPEDPS